MNEVSGENQVKGEKDHDHYNGICHKEFRRGHAFGRRESYDELFGEGTKYKTTFHDDMVTIVIPRSKFIELQHTVEANL